MANETNWDKSWHDIHTQPGGFYSLLKKRFAWPFEGFITSTARLLRAGEISLENTRVLDFGCGQGRHAMFFAKTGFQNVHGIDISEVSVTEAGMWAKAEGFDIDYRFYDGENLPYDDGMFDLVTCFGTFHHLPESIMPRVASEISRVVKPGGHFLWSEISKRTTGSPLGEKIGPYSYYIDDATDPEHGMIQHLFPLDVCFSLFPAFRFDIAAREELYGAGLDRVQSCWNLIGRKQ